MNKVLKIAAESLFEELGMNLTTAFNIYENDILVLTLTRTGSHSNLFGK